ncbi:Uncharacterized protein dnm_017400 [Desulfonema magnum]|uniref:Uncharacterized protein n=1 Tax=Desulfonema magnum TaxID=45655 RepID=A0A975BHU6_9BACT|nr:Uncharacterized protein dnm_017400 [Desulfonema magnum]
MKKKLKQMKKWKQMRIKYQHKIFCIFPIKMRMYKNLCPDI